MNFKITSLLLVFFALVGCGARDPFSRGDSKSVITAQSSELTKPKTLSAEFFVKEVHPVLSRDCTSCHGHPASTFEEAQALVVAGKPEQSLLLTKATGKSQHPKRWEATSAEVLLLTAWITGAKIDSPPFQEGPEEFFNKAVKSYLQQSCTDCHESRDTYAEAKSLITPGSAEQSVLYVKASGVRHRKVWSKDSQQLGALKKWIELEK